jgi:hypothetical protein
MITNLTNIFSVFNSASTSPEKLDALNLLYWQQLATQLLSLPPLGIK